MRKDNKKIPTYLKRFFWDTRLSDIEIDVHSPFVIERILEWGDRKSVNWLLGTYSAREIKPVIVKSRNISPKTANFWRLKFNIKEPILCLNKQYQERQKKFWRI